MLVRLQTRKSTISCSEQVKWSIRLVYNMKLSYSLPTSVIIFAIFLTLITASSDFLSEVEAANDAFSVREEVNSTNDKKDIFGISEIYPTISGGREWFVNMTNPANSSHFSETGGFEMVR